MHGIYQVNIINWQVEDKFIKQVSLKEIILYTNIMYLKAFVKENLYFFWEKWGNEAMDHEMDF